MSEMNPIILHLYRDRWVLASSRKVDRGMTLDAPPVRIIPHSDRKELTRALRDVAHEHIPVVPQPDYNDPLYRIGFRAQALNLKSWLAFVRHSRCFNLMERENSLVLEEWPRDGGSFSAKAAWRVKFPVGALDAVADHLVQHIPPVVAAPRKMNVSRSKRQ